MADPQPPKPDSATIYPFASNLAPEECRYTADGIIWPRGRAMMRERKLIRQRMAEDMVGLLKGQPTRIITTDDLLCLGWRRQQVEENRTAVEAMVAPLQTRQPGTTTPNPHDEVA